MTWYEIILTCSSLFTAIVTAIVLINQYRLQKQQLNAQQLEHQPTFKFEQNSIRWALVNAGESILQPAQISISPILMIEFMDIRTPETLYMLSIEITGLHQVFYTRNVQGILAYRKLYLETHMAKIQELQTEIDSYLIHNSCGLIAKMPGTSSSLFSELIRINYKDRYKISRTICYWNKCEISEEHYHKLKQRAHEVHINQLCLDLLINLVRNARNRCKRS